MCDIFKIIQIAAIISSLVGTYFLAFGLKIKRGIDEGFEKELGLNKRNDLVAPSDVRQNKIYFILGLAFITLAALLQILIAVFS